MANDSLANQALGAIDSLDDAAPDFIAYDERLESVPDDKAIRDLANLGTRLKQLTRQIEEQEARLETMRKDLSYLSEVTIPDKMTELGVTSFRLADGTEITTKPQIFVGITKQNEEAAYAWLRKNNYGGLIKTNYLLAFGRAETEAAKEAAHLLRVSGFGDRLEIKEQIHPSTLKAWATEQDKAGQVVPAELISIHRVNKARIK